MGGQGLETGGGLGVSLAYFGHRSSFHAFSPTDYRPTDGWRDGWMEEWMDGWMTD